MFQHLNELNTHTTVELMVIFVFYRIKMFGVCVYTEFTALKINIVYALTLLEV